MLLLIRLVVFSRLLIFGVALISLALLLLLISFFSSLSLLLFFGESGLFLCLGALSQGNRLPDLVTSRLELLLAMVSDSVDLRHNGL